MKHALIAFAIACATALAPHLAAAQADPTEAELRDAYARWVLSLGSYEYRARHILVPTADEAVAALNEIKAGAAFASVAERVSKDPGSRAKGGDLGWVMPSYFVPEFRVAFRGMETGLHPSAIRTPFGWHVVLVEEWRQVTIPRFEQKRADIEAMVKRERAAQAKAAAPVPIPNWSDDQWNALWFAANHTMGVASFVYREANYADREEAERASRTRVLLASSARTPQRARHLIDVEPALRFGLARLYTAGATSAPVDRLLPDGRLVWTVLQLVSRESAPRLQGGAAFQAEAAAWVAKGLLAPPHLLLEQPAARARVAWWRARTLEQLAAVAPELSPEVEYGNSSTPLLDAMLRRDMAFAKALVARGADVNHCGLWGCPVNYAARFEDGSEALAWVEWLLAAGAKPDAIDKRGPDVSATALSAAAWAGHLPVIQRLVAAGASIHGTPEAFDTPIEGAASAGRKAVVEWFIARGASVLPRRNPRGMGKTSIAEAALESNDKAFIAWAEKTVLDAAAKQPEFALALHFEQGGKRIEADAQGQVKLKAAPFKMVFRMAPNAVAVHVGASFDAAWLDEVRKTDLRNAMFRPFASGALANVDEPDSKFMLITGACAADTKADPGCDGVHMVLGIDPEPRRDFHERRAGNLYVRAIDELIDTAPGATAKPLRAADLAGRTLYVGAGVPVALGGGSGLRFVQPKWLMVSFTR